MILLLLVAMFDAGCNRETLTYSDTDWKPTGTGPIELRPLPPAAVLHTEYSRWRENDSTSKVRLYETVFLGQANQLQFDVRYGTGDTPIGATDTTIVTFMYRTTTNGDYKIEWHLNGRHDASFLKIGEKPKRVWLLPFAAEEGSNYYIDNKFHRAQILSHAAPDPD